MECGCCSTVAALMAQVIAEGMRPVSGDTELTPYLVPVLRQKNRHHVLSPAGPALHAR